MTQQEQSNRPEDQGLIYFDACEDEADRRDWRFAHFSVVLPVSEEVEWRGDLERTPWFDFAQGEGGDQWRYGRFPGVRGVQQSAMFRGGASPEHPELERVDVSHYSDSRERYASSRDSFGSDAFDALTGGTFTEAEARRRVGSVFSAAEAAVHHLILEPKLGETVFRLYSNLESYFRHAPTPDSSTIRVEAIEVLQFVDHRMVSGDHTSYETKKVGESFIVVHVAAENISGWCLDGVNYALKSAEYSVTVKDDLSPVELTARKRFGSGDECVFAELSVLSDLYLHRYIQGLAYDAIDRALGRRELSIVTVLKSAPHAASSDRRPRHVSLAIPNWHLLDNGFSRPAAFQAIETDWEWFEEWLWALSSQCRLTDEHLPTAGRKDVHNMISATTRYWTIGTLETGIGVIQNEIPRFEESAFLRLATTRYVDLVLLQYRSKIAYERLRHELRTIRQDSTITHQRETQHSNELRHQAMRADRARLENLRLSALEVSEKFGVVEIPDHPIDSAILQDLQTKSGVAQLRRSFERELESREKVVASQCEQLGADCAKQEADMTERYQNTVNLVFALAAGALAGPDWAEVFDPGRDFWGSLAAGLIIAALMFFAYKLATWRLERRRPGADE